MPLPKSIWDDPELSPKIKEACRIARDNGYRYIWIDSCCINKQDSLELSEAINSMYKWYSLAEVCYASLADVPTGEDHHAEDSAFHKSRWFCRGWTLQELIAPFDVVFLSKDWVPIGSKHNLVDLVQSVTKINHKALLHLEPLDTFSVAQRLSWAAERSTEKMEDRAYSLLGIFNINMPTLYGEGDNAFQRLQEQIMQRIPDQSLFVWGALDISCNLADTQNDIRIHASRYQGSRQTLFATSPDYFEHCAHIMVPRRADTGPLQLPSSQSHNIEYTFTSNGVRTQFRMIHLTRNLLLHMIPHGQSDIRLKFEPGEEYGWYIAILGCEHAKHPGYLLGRFCYVPSSDSAVEFVHPGRISIRSEQGEEPSIYDLFPLSPQTIMRCRPHTELKTVYIPHPNCATLPPDHRDQPYNGIALLLLKETHDALRSQGYSAELRDPDPAHPMTHSLTLFKDENTITVDFLHTLEDGGKCFTIKTEVTASGSRGHTGSMSTSSASSPWLDNIDLGSVEWSGVGNGILVVHFRMDFAGCGYYFLRVDVVSDAPPSC